MTDEGFLRRWSRLKRGSKRVRRGRASPVLPVEQDRPAEGGPPGTVAPENQASEPPDLPSIEGLDKDSDFSAFMKQGVPEELRRVALRKLWRLTPSIPDGLDDYDEDYSLAAALAEKVSSLYKGRQGVPGPEDEEAPGESEEAGTERAPLAAGDDDAGAETVSGAAGEESVEAEETTGASHDSHDTDSDVAVPAGPREGPGKA